MVLNDLLGKDVRVTYVHQTDDIVGELKEIDSETNTIHVYHHFTSTDHLIPLFSVKSIKQQF